MKKLISMVLCVVLALGVLAGCGAAPQTDETAEKLGFTTEYFCRFFKKNFGESFIDYLNDYRMDRAAQALLLLLKPTKPAQMLWLLPSCGSAMPTP